MREFTRKLKKEAQEDLIKIHQHNNSKNKKRTPEQIEQSKKDKMNYFINKWADLLEKSETKAQKVICVDVLMRAGAGSFKKG